ncbi:MAG: DUF3791 domain-containing protein [Clostridia bacterium]|nr:DUF3791 domain-containing protein [Clostridia bacterium]
MGKLTEEQHDIINYIVVCVSEFAEKYGIGMDELFEYLKTYKGIEYLQSYYDVEHLCSFSETVESLTAICKKHGGNFR